jgi:hypothetical protein
VHCLTSELITGQLSLYFTHGCHVHAALYCERAQLADGQASVPPTTASAARVLDALCGEAQFHQQLIFI